MGAFDNILTIFILLTLSIIIYLRMTNKSLVDFYREIREIFAENKEEVVSSTEYNETNNNNKSSNEEFYNGYYSFDAKLLWNEFNWL